MPFGFGFFAAGAGAAGIPALLDQYVANAHTIGSPFISAWPYNGTTIGSKYANPAVASGAPSDGFWDQIAFNRTATAVANTSNLTPFVHAYAFSAGFGTKYANPASLPAARGQALGFRPQDDVLIVAQDNAAGFLAYSWSPAGFGVLLSAPASNSADVRSVNWLDDGNAVAGAVSAGGVAYAWAAGWGTKFSDPTPYPNVAVGQGVAFRKQLDAIVMSGGVNGVTTYRMSAYAWSASGFGARFSDPASGIGSNTNLMKFKNDGTTIFSIHQNGTMYAYSWSSGWGTLSTSSLSSVRSFTPSNTTAQVLSIAAGTLTNSPYSNGGGFSAATQTTSGSSNSVGLVVG